MYQSKYKKILGEDSMKYLHPCDFSFTNYYSFATLVNIVVQAEERRNSMNQHTIIRRHLSKLEKLMSVRNDWKNISTKHELQNVGNMVNVFKLKMPKFSSQFKLTWEWIFQQNEGKVLCNQQNRQTYPTYCLQHVKQYIMACSDLWGFSEQLKLSKKTSKIIANNPFLHVNSLLHSLKHAHTRRDTEIQTHKDTDIRTYIHDNTYFGSLTNFLRSLANCKIIFLSLTDLFKVLFINSSRSIPVESLYCVSKLDSETWKAWEYQYSYTFLDIVIINCSRLSSLWHHLSVILFFITIWSQTLSDWVLSAISQHLQHTESAADSLMADTINPGSQSVIKAKHSHIIDKLIINVPAMITCNSHTMSDQCHILIFLSISDWNLLFSCACYQWRVGIISIFPYL